MSGTPTKPVTIGSPRPSHASGQVDSPDNRGRNAGLISSSYASQNLNAPPVSASPRPADLERLREQFGGGTPPPNIPVRAFPTTSSPFRNSSTTALLGNSAGTPRSYGSSNLATGFGGRASPYGSRPGTPLGTRQFGGGAGRESPDPYAPPEDNNTPFDINELPDEEKARILRRHLVHRDDRKANASPSPGPSKVAPSGELNVQPGAETSSTAGVGSSRASLVNVPSPHQHEETEPFPIPYNALGGDITHDIYKWQSDHRKAQNEMRRARSVSVPSRHIRIVDPAFEHLHEPGGFRRNYLMLKANEQGTEQPQVLGNFIDFLYIFGHFAGEDLEEDEEGDEDILPEEVDDDQAIARDDEAVAYRAPGPSAATISELRGRARVPLRAEDLDKPIETTPLIKPRSQSRMSSKMRRSRRSSIGPQHGDATVPQAVLMLLKSFIGTGVLFLGKAFYNGGMLFSTITLVLIAAISLHSFLLLVQTKFAVSGSFGDIGGTLYGPWMRKAILFSIVVSQLGFVSAYLIFVAENLQAFILAVTNCARVVPIGLLILAQLVVFLPLALIRNLARLSTTALIADAFIFIGLIYIASNEIASIASRGVADIKWFNEKDFPLLIGTAVFSFEGIGLVIPITDSMREPRKFPMVLSGVMLFLTLLFGGAGMLSYAAYGSDIQTVVIVNLPQDKKFVQVVQFLYSVAILLSAPLQLFPALRILENAIWSVRSGKVEPRVKWEKNGFRTLAVIFCGLLSWAGAKDLDKFVSFVGSFCCIPLCYIYPPMLHLKAVARTRAKRIGDYALIIFGAAATVYTSMGTIKLMLEPSSGEEGPQFGRCSPHTGH